MLKLNTIQTAIPAYLLNKPIEENNSNGRKSPKQAVIIPFVIIISSTERIEFELKKGIREISKDVYNQK